MLAGVKLEIAEDMVKILHCQLTAYDIWIIRD